MTIKKAFHVLLVLKEEKCSNRLIIQLAEDILNFSNGGIVSRE